MSTDASGPTEFVSGIETFGSVEGAPRPEGLRALRPRLAEVAPVQSALAAHFDGQLAKLLQVEIDELLVIDGVDEATADELQTRAREFLEAQARAAMERAQELGVEDSLINFEGLTPQMLQVLAEDGVLNLEDFATCADWELAGGWTTVDGERVKDTGLLEEFDVSLEEAQDLIMTARVMLGWVDPEELVAEDATEEVEED